MKTRSLKLQIATTFVILLSLSMFMLSCVWVMLTQRQLVEKEIDLLKVYAEKLAAGAGDGEVLCYRIEKEGPVPCSPMIEETGDQSRGEGESQETITYRGSQWAVLTFSHKYLVVKKSVSSPGRSVSKIIIERPLEPLYQSIRDDWKIMIYYLLINVIIFASLGLLKLYTLVIRPVERLIDISDKSSPLDGMSFYSGSSNNEFSKLSHGLNRMVKRIGEDNKTLSASVDALESANRELRRNETEMIRTEKLASVGRLSAGLAHEIGNPLGIVQGYVDMLGTPDLAEQERQQFSERAKSELQRIDALIRQLLDMSRKGQEGSSTSVNVQQLIEKVVDFFTVQKKNCEILITTEFEAGDDTVAGDEDQLRQVFLNCLMNATDAVEENSGDGPGKIDIVCENVTVEETKSVRIRIIDNGPGVDSGQIDKIFDPFFTTKATGKGTGLGLYVSYTIVEGMGGTIRLNNLQPVGAEVVIQLPCIPID